MNHQFGEINQERSSCGRWLILAALIGLVMVSLGCSLGGRLERLPLVGDRRQTTVARYLALATYTPWPTFTPTVLPLVWPTATATWIPWPTPTSHIPSPTWTATATVTPPPSPIPPPTNTPLPARPSATPTPAITATPVPVVVAATRAPTTAAPVPTPTPGYDYVVNEVYIDHTTVPFLTGYIAVVNSQEIPIGGVKAVGVFEPGGQRHESPLSQWFFDVATAPGAVAKTGSVKFEPGGIQAGTWYIHLENEQGVRLSEDVGINTDPGSPEWFYIKFKQTGPAGVAVASAPTPTSPLGAMAATPASGVTATSTSEWSFLNVNVIRHAWATSMFLYGDMVNDSDASQEILYLTGSFTDDDGRTVDGENYTYDYWPVDVVAPGGRVPFELEVNGVNSIQDYSLRLISEPSGSTLRQDFEFSELDAYYDEAGDYCVEGRLRNPGGGLQEYLTIVAVLYNDQGNVIYFDSYDVWYPQEVVGDQGEDFEVCVDPLGQEVARYEVRAWGQ